MNTFLNRMETLKHTWSAWARPEQMLPLGTWFLWLILAGRGWGKTRTAVETTRIWTRTNPIVNLVGATLDDARSILIEGPAGILATCPKAERPVHTKSKRLLTWPNGARSEYFSGEEPDRLRGPQCHKLICDELAAWRMQRECWDNAMLGLRLGDHPQVLAVTTPRPTKLIRELAASEHTYLTRGITAENASNLASTFFTQITERFKGTRLGEQELMGRILEDRQGALWTWTMIEAARLTRAPDDIDRIVVAIDPATTSHKGSDETGIVVVARDRQKPRHFYVLADLSCSDTPDGWAKKAVAAYHSYGADKIIGEANQGGDLIGATVHHVDPNVAFKKVHATRGKALRAEPISALYQQGRVHHIGVLTALEDQLTDWTPESSDSPDRLDANVWGLTELSEHGGYDSGLIQFWGEQAAAMKNKTVESTPGQSIVELGKAQIESYHGSGGKTFGANKSNVMVTARVKDVNGRGHLPSVCPNPSCGKALSIYATHGHCNGCGWDSRSEAAPQPEPAPAPEAVKRPLDFLIERLLG